HGARRVGRVDAGDAVDDAALANRLRHLLGDVADGEPAGGSKLSLVLEDLHRSPPSFVDGRWSADNAAYCEGSARVRRVEPLPGSAARPRSGVPGPARRLPGGP